MYMYRATAVVSVASDALDPVGGWPAFALGFLLFSVVGAPFPVAVWALCVVP